MSEEATLACDMTAIPEEERERLCCPFFDFKLYVASDAGPVWITLAGGSDVKGHLEQTLIPRLERA